MFYRENHITKKYQLSCTITFYPIFLQQLKFPWLGTLAAAKNRIKGYSTGQLIFVRDMILPIKHTMYWELIREKNQTQINKDNIR